VTWCSRSLSQVHEVGDAAAVWHHCAVAQKQWLFLGLCEHILHSDCHLLVDLLAYFSTLKTEAVLSSETSVNFCQITRRHIPMQNQSLFDCPTDHTPLLTVRVLIFSSLFTFSYSSSSSLSPTLVPPHYLPHNDMACLQVCGWGTTSRYY
jgi:hypothetical protein